MDRERERDKEEKEKERERDRGKGKTLLGLVAEHGEDDADIKDRYIRDKEIAREKNKDGQKER